jgi:hypothetical protein
MNPVRTPPPDGVYACASSCRGIDGYWTKLFEAGLQLGNAFGWAGRVSDKIAQAFAVHDLVRRTAADLIDVDLNALGDLFAASGGAGSDDGLAHTDLNCVVQRPAFTARGQRE